VVVEELAATPLILREHGSGTRKALEQAMRRSGHEPTAHVELGSTAAIKAAVLARDGASVLSRLAVADEVADGQLRVVPLAGLELRRRLRAVWRAGTPPIGPAAELLACAVAADRLASRGRP
jgi:DNA-binding transcriptional LysR family regulator